MKEKSLLRWWVVLCLLIVSACAVAARPERNAFLNRKANSITELVQQVRSDNEVMDRYRRHFGKEDSEIVQMLSTLHAARLNEDGTYMIYSVDERTGVIKATPQRLKAGTRVFADAAGNPVLKANCGNAMVPGSDNGMVTSINPAMPTMNESTRAVAVTTPETTEAVIPTASALAPMEPVALAPSAPQVSTGSSNQGFALPAALAALGGGAAVLLSGGGGSAPVPEPASIVVIAGAIGAMVARRRSKK